MMFLNQRLTPTEIVRLMPELRDKLFGPMFFKELILPVMPFKMDKEIH